MEMEMGILFFRDSLENEMLLPLDKSAPWTLTRISCFIIPSILCIPAIYYWKKCIQSYIAFKKDSEFHQRHNRVIMISRPFLKGWIPACIRFVPENLDCALEPFLYFIDSAKESLDIAVMSVSIQNLLDALKAAAERGVKIRLILDFQSANRSKHEAFRRLMQSGVQICFHVENDGALNHIMHMKYIVKDYSQEEGYLCLGSMNYSNISTIINNYEDIVFTSNHNLVEQFHMNFQTIWDIITRNNSNIVKKTILRGAGYV